MGVQLCVTPSSWAGICRHGSEASRVGEGRCPPLASPAAQMPECGRVGRMHTLLLRQQALRSPWASPLGHVPACLPVGCCCCRDFPPPGPPPVRAPPKELTMFIAGLGPSTHERVSGAAQATHTPAILRGLPCLVKSPAAAAPTLTMFVLWGDCNTGMCLRAGWFEHTTAPGLLYPLQLYPTLIAVWGLPTSLAHSPVQYPDRNPWLSATGSPTPHQQPS